VTRRYRDQPEWGIYYKRDTYPGTYGMDYEAAVAELMSHGDEGWTELIYG
jgi:hypothetical protein